MPLTPLLPPLVLVACLAGSLVGQRTDSATTARGLMRRAAVQLVAGDTSGAADLALQAAASWPRQVAYEVTAARYAAAARRTNEALAALGRANAAGYSWDPSSPTLAALTGAPGYAALAAVAASNAAPLIRSAVYRTLPDPMLHPEGVAWDSLTGRIYLSSVRQAKVIAIEPDGRVRELISEAAGLEATFGLLVDQRRRLLWIATSRTPEQERPGTVGRSGAALVAVRLDDGREVERWVIADTSQPHLLGDLVLAPDGTVWATDSRTPALYQVIPDRRGGTLTRSPIHSSDWASLQGLAFDAAGGVAWVADWTTGLYRIELATGTVTPVAAAVTDVTLGIDGLYLAGPGRLIGLQNGVAPARVIELRLDPTGTRVDRLEVLDRHLPLAEEPTLGVLARGGLLYVANSPWSHYRADGTPDPANPFPPPVLLRLPLGP